MSRRLEGPAAVGHLLRRAAFGASPTLLASLSGGAAFEEVLEHLLDGLDPPPIPLTGDFDPYVPGRIQQAWLERMLSGVAPLAEKLALFWHCHFATSDAKVQDPLMLWRQYELFRSRGAGRFVDLVKAVSRDVAMIVWLDGNANRKGQPNENFARELQELFLLGIGHYSESDVREVARAFTGWGSRRQAFSFDARFHDAGTKTIHGRRGAFDGDDVIDLLTETSTCRRHLSAKLLRFFSHPAPSEAEIDHLEQVWAKSRGDMRAVLRALFTAPHFLDADHARSRIMPPIDFTLSALGAVGALSIPPWVQPALGRMGQILFRPPSVKGWPEGEEWLGAASLIARFDVAARSAEAIDDGEAADAALARLFDGSIPRGMARLLASRSPRDRVALALASPEAQLA